MTTWEEAWQEYLDALEAYEADWCGEDFVFDIARVARRLQEAKRTLRRLDAAFCERLAKIDDPNEPPF